MTSPVCVATGDVHFTVATLELATSVVKQARKLAHDLHVPLLLNGDTLDSKAIIRGEVANRLIEILTDPVDMPPRTIINTGNHDLLHQKAKESSLKFLTPYAEVIAEPTWDEDLQGYVVPYFDSTEELQAFLNTVEKGSRLFLHQGVMGAEMGAYIKDSSSLPREAFADFRVIASHYHKRQEIKCGRPRKGAVGLFSYLGSPYTITYTEAGDGPKGINILYDNGILELVPTNLRKHVIIEARVGEEIKSNANPGDLIWLKLSGPQSELAMVNKRELGMKLFGHVNFRLDRVITEASKIDTTTEKLTDLQVIDKLIDQTSEPEIQKANLKVLARGVLSS